MNLAENEHANSESLNIKIYKNIKFYKINVI